MTTKKLIIASLLAVFAAGCAALVQMGHVLDSIHAVGGSLDGLLLLLLVGVAIAGISWRPDAEDRVG